MQYIDLKIYKCDSHWFSILLKILKKIEVVANVYMVLFLIILILNKNYLSLIFMIKTIITNLNKYFLLIVTIIYIMYNIII